MRYCNLGQFEKAGNSFEDFLGDGVHPSGCRGFLRKLQCFYAILKVV